MPHGKVVSTTYVYGGNGVAKNTIVKLSDDQAKEVARRNPPDIVPVTDAEASEAVKRGARAVDLTPGNAPKPKERSEKAVAPKPAAPAS